MSGCVVCGAGGQGGRQHDLLLLLPCVRASQMPLLPAPLPSPASPRHARTACSSRAAGASSAPTRRWSKNSTSGRCAHSQARAGAASPPRHKGLPSTVRQRRQRSGRSGRRASTEHSMFFPARRVPARMGVLCTGAGAGADSVVQRCISGPQLSGRVLLLVQLSGHARRPGGTQSHLGRAP